MKTFSYYGVNVRRYLDSKAYTAIPQCNGQTIY